MFIEGIVLLTSFLIGSIPFAVIIGKRHNVDIRQVGSRNPGATNVFHNVGRRWGILVAFLDGLKGLSAVFLAYFAGLTTGMMLLAGFAAVAGHCFMPVYKFKGG